MFFSMDDYSPPSSPDASPRADSPTPTAFCDVSFVDESTVSGKFATLPARFHVYTHPQYHFPNSTNFSPPRSCLTLLDYVPTTSNYFPPPSFLTLLDYLLGEGNLYYLLPFLPASCICC